MWKFNETNMFIVLHKFMFKGSGEKPQTRSDGRDWGLRASNLPISKREVFKLKKINIFNLFVITHHTMCEHITLQKILRAKEETKKRNHFNDISMVKR